MLTGDALAVQLFIASLCPAALLAALPLPQPQQGRLRRALIAFGITAGALALVWSPLVSLFPALGTILGAYVTGSWATLALLMATFVAVAYSLLKRLDHTTPAPADSSPIRTALSPQICTDASIWGGIAAAKLLPRFSATITTPLSRVRIYVEVSHFNGGWGANDTWTKPEPLLISEFRDLITGQKLLVNLLSPFEVDGAAHWRWGPDDMRYNFVRHRDYRGRVLAVPDDFPSFSTHFIVVQNEPSEMPLLVGEQLFDFSRTNYFAS